MNKYELAESKFFNNHYKEALGIYLELKESLSDPDDWFLHRIASCYLKIDDKDKALEYFDKAYEKKAKEKLKKLYKQTVEDKREQFNKSMMNYWSEFDPPYFILEKLSPVVSTEYYKNCRIVSNRDEMLKYLPKDGVIAEVGVQKGVFSELIVNHTEPEILHLIDLNYDVFCYEPHQERIDQKKMILHTGDSSLVLQDFVDNYFDWIYIDGDHRYPGVVRDIDQSVKKVKEGGILVFNDYTVWSPLEAIPYGVFTAVNELLNTGKWEAIFLALHPLGYHDIALRQLTDL